MAISDTILKLTKQLYPTGRAFKMPFGGDFERLHKALAQSESRAYEDAFSILNSILPDNDLFTADDATDWERRLGLISNPAVPLVDRKLAISRKMAFPGTIKARSNYRFLQHELRAAGFDVYVYENRFDDGLGGYVTKTPAEAAGASYSQVQHGQVQHGNARHGVRFVNRVVNYIDESRDSLFDVGSNFRSTFFVGGPLAVGLITTANIDADRKEEFRQMILRIKPVQTVGFLIVNYV